MNRGFKVIIMPIVLFLSIGAVPLKEPLRITGSASVYPIVTFILENYPDVQKKASKNPVIESIGTGAGFDAFCKTPFSGNSPDIISASREITDREMRACRNKGINNLEKITLGLDGIILAFSKNNPIFKNLNFSIEDLFHALSPYIVEDRKVVKNRYKKWSDIRISLPDSPIIIYGPSSNSGTYEFFIETLQKYCLSLPEMKDYFGDKVRENCKNIRLNEVYFPIIDQDSIISRKIELRKGAIGILRFGFFSNSGKFGAAKIEGLLPSKASIISKRYKIARPLFLYYNVEKIPLVKGMREFLIEAAIFSYTNGNENFSTLNNEASALILPYSNNRGECLKNQKILKGNFNCDNI